jgi:hypothetical protein
MVHPLIAVVRRKDIRKALRLLSRLHRNSLGDLPRDPALIDLPQVERLNTLLATLVPDAPRIKVRICLDLSRALNDSILDWPLCYMSIEDLVLVTPPAGHVATVDFKSYFKQLPHDPRQHFMMGFQLDNTLYHYTVCPFGVKTGPAYASTITAVVCAFLKHLHGIDTVAYIDDIAIVGSSYHDCDANLRSALALFSSLGLQLSPDKVTSPSQCPTFLGITLDTRLQRLSISTDRILEYRDHVRHTLTYFDPVPPATSAPGILPSDLASIIGELQHISSVYFEGRQHLPALYALQVYRRGRARTSGPRIRPSPAALAELSWWLAHLDVMLSDPTAVPWSQYWSTHLPTLTPVWSDASGHGGFGLITRDRALQGSVHLAASEDSSGSYKLIPLLCALRLWGTSLRGRILLWVTDNANNTRLLNRGTPTLSSTTHLLAVELLDLASALSLTLLAVWAPREQLQLLDDLSKYIIRLDSPDLQGSPTALPL